MMRLPIFRQVEIRAAAVAGVCVKEWRVGGPATVEGALFDESLGFSIRQPGLTHVKKDRFGWAGHNQWYGGHVGAEKTRGGNVDGHAGRSKHAKIMGKCESVVCGEAAAEPAIELVGGGWETGSGAL